MSPFTVAAALLAAAFAAGAAATPLRDPMQPPARRAPAATAPAAAAEAAPLPVVRQIVVVGDERFVVDQGRRRRVGDLLGGLRIERIEEAAVVVREGATLRRLPLYAGVAKRPPSALPPPVSEPVPADRPSR